MTLLSTMSSRTTIEVDGMNNIHTGVMVSSDAAWYKMNYPRMINKNWYKKEHEMNYLGTQVPKDTTNLFQRKDLVKPVNLRAELDSITQRQEPAPGQFNHLKKPTVRTLTAVPTEYKREVVATINKTNINGEDLANVLPISNIVPKEKKPDAAKEYHDLIWEFEEVMKRKIPVEYVSEDARHYAVTQY